MGNAQRPIFNGQAKILTILFYFFYALLTVIAPLQEHRSESKACAEGRQYDVVSLLQSVFVVAKADRNRGSAGIANVLNVHQYLAFIEIKTLRHGLDDTEICLMRYLRKMILLMTQSALEEK